MLVSHLVLLPLTVAVGWYGTRTSLHLRHATNKRSDAQLMLVLAWSPLVVGLLALLLTLSRSKP
jgi:ABC-type molybdate transport system permease subunit